MTTMDSTIDRTGVDSEDPLLEHWGWLLGLGGLSVVAGVTALLSPALSGLAVEVVLGALILTEGFLEAVHAIRLRHLPGAGWRGFGALLAMGLGGMLLGYPGAGVLGLALMLGSFFVAAGLIKLALAWQLERIRGRGWLAFHGVLSTTLGALILCGWPWTAPGVLGLLVGVDLMFSGWWLVMLALAARAAAS